MPRTVRVARATAEQLAAGALDLAALLPRRRAFR